jgi:hypothetical protein
MATRAGRGRQGKAGRENYEAVLRLLAQERRNGYGRRQGPAPSAPAVTSASTWA